AGGRLRWSRHPSIPKEVEVVFQQLHLLNRFVGGHRFEFKAFGTHHGRRLNLAVDSKFIEDFRLFGCEPSQIRGLIARPRDLSRVIAPDLTLHLVDSLIYREPLVSLPSFTTKDLARRLDRKLCRDDLAAIALIDRP